MAETETTDISMSVKQRVEHANMMPVLGSLTQEKEAKALRYKFADCLAQVQLEGWGIIKSEGKYSFNESVDDTTKNAPTIVKLTDEEILYFQNFIAEWDRRKVIGIENVSLYETINSLNPTITNGD